MKSTKKGAAAFHPVEASKRIREAFFDAISTAFPIADGEYQALFRQKLYTPGAIANGPTIETTEGLCGAPFSSSDVGKWEKAASRAPCKEVPIEMFEELSKSEEAGYHAIFRKYRIRYDGGKSAASNVYCLCFRSALYRKFRAETDSPAEMPRLAAALGISLRQTVAFLRVCMMAEYDKKPLFHARYRMSFRDMGGLYAPICGEKQVFLERQARVRAGSRKVACFERAVCQNCGDLGLVGKIRREGTQEKLVFAARTNPEAQYFHIRARKEPIFEEVEFEEIEDPAPVGQEARPMRYRKYALCPVCGAIGAIDGEPQCKCGRALVVLSQYENGSRCTKCQKGSYKRFYMDTAESAGILMAALSEEFPEPAQDEREEGACREGTGGRRVLSIFQSAGEALFAPRFEEFYRRFLCRCGLLQVVEKLKRELSVGPMPVDELAKSLARLFVKYETFQTPAGPLSARELGRVSLKQAWMAILRELVYAKKRSSLVSLGKMQFCYGGNSEAIVFPMREKYKIKGWQSQEILDYAALSFAYFGALRLDEDVLDAADLRELFHADGPKGVVLEADPADRRSMSWKARRREGSADFYPNDRVRKVARMLRSDECRAHEFLEEYFTQWLTSPANVYRLERGEDGAYYMPVEHYEVKIWETKGAYWYRCQTCGKCSIYNLDEWCMEIGCHGALQEIDPATLDASNRYLRLCTKYDLTALPIETKTEVPMSEDHPSEKPVRETAETPAGSPSPEAKFLGAPSRILFELVLHTDAGERVTMQNVPPAAFSMTYEKERSPGA